MTYALHVHVGMPSGDTAIAVMTALKPYLPILLALSASSPFWQGIDTDYASFRQRILASMRSYGQPPAFATWQEFVELFQAGKEAGMFDIIRDIHWDLRPQPDLGTLEIRVMDSQPTIREASALTALVHSLVVALQHGHLQGKSDFRLTPCHSWIEKENYFQASYQGLDACYIENNRGSHRPIAAIAQDILQALEPTANQLGESAHLKFLADRLASGPSYCRQRRVFQQTGAKKAVVASLVRELLEETCPRLDDFPAIAVEPVFPPNGLQPSPSVLE
jgi:carboxylate-amine ligase